MSRVAVLVAGIFLLVAVSAQADSPSAPRIPLCAGLTIVTAVSEVDGDYESVKRVEAIADGLLKLRYESEQAERTHGAVTRILKSNTRREIPLADARDATAYLHMFVQGAPKRVPGSTAIGISSAVLRALKATGRAEMGLFTFVTRGTTADRNQSPNIYEYLVTGELTQVRRVSIPVIVNDTPAALPAIHARADFNGDKAEFFFLDDDRNPLALRYRIGIGAGASGTATSSRDKLDVIRIAFDCSEREADAVQSQATSLELALARGEPVDIYSIFFSFNSATIRPESADTLGEIGAILRRHPKWRLSIVGHTDSIASGSYNLALSQRRAEAVRQALISGEHVAAARLTAAGAGESAPRATNETLEGRARNRRVELKRLP